MKQIFLLGSLNTDLVMNTPYIPEAGETMKGSGFAIHFGGKGANQAAAAAKLGGLVRMAGCVGNDRFGADMRANLEQFGVDMRAVRTVPDQSSGVAVILVSHGNNRILLSAGANECVTERDVDALLAAAQQGDLFLTQLETPLAVTGYALKTARKKGMVTVLNPAPATLEIQPYFPYVDILTPNETEMALFSYGATLAEAAKQLGVPHVIVTLGGEGWYYYHEGEERYGSCPSVSVVDTTAAGDTFCGALVSRLAQGSSIVDALPFASVAASLACTKAGAQPSIPTLEEVDRLYGKIVAK